MKFSYYDGDTLCITIIADASEHTLKIEDYTGRVIKTASRDRGLIADRVCNTILLRQKEL